MFWWRSHGAPELVSDTTWLTTGPKTERTGRLQMTVKLGILALLQAESGKGDELAAFLQAGRALALAEEGTVTWYAFK